MMPTKKQCLVLCSIFVVVWIIYIIKTSMTLNHKPISRIIDILPHNKIEDIYKSGIGNDRDKMVKPVIIVEEHHEVIPYWYAIAEKTGRRNGFTVLHIDGHSDDAYPIITDNFPLFKYPRIISQVSHLMQKNDVFVMGAVATGLIGRYIWVWPPWDKKNHKTDYIKNVFTIGKIYLEEETLFCTCVENRNNMKCFMVNSTNSEIPIEKNKCDFNNKVQFIYEEVSEDNAINLINDNKEWINKYESVILDIDEDYYGCESVVSKLYSLGMHSKDVKHLETLTNLLFCGSTALDEIQADKFLHSLTERIIQLNNKSKYCTKTKPNCINSIQVQSLLFQSIPSILQPIEAILCSDEAPIYLQSLMRILLQCTNLELKVISEIGVCLTESSKTLDFTPGMRFCVSYNDPNSTLVLFHTPTDDEIRTRSQNFKKLLQADNIRPVIITLTRSVRDGYTPRHQSNQIEDDVLNIIYNSSGSISYLDRPYYDPNLLGGKRGWYRRYS